jgi:hypothetical protein
MSNPHQEPYQVVRDWLIQNQEHLKIITKPVFQTYNNLILSEDPVWKQEINDQFLKMVNELIITEITSCTAIDLCTIMIELEQIDLRRYLEC